MYKKILLAVDGSDHSIQAAEDAVKLHDLIPESVIDVVFVADYEKSKYDILHAHDKEKLDLDRRKQLLPIEQLLTAHHVNHHYHLLHGKPGETIVTFQKQGHYDLIILGSSGLGALKEMVMGSVSKYVVKHATCPVLVIK